MDVAKKRPVGKGSGKPHETVDRPPFLWENPRMRLQFTFNTFDSAEAESLTGVTRVMQRDWRRERHLKAQDGSSRYELFDLCELWVLSACARVGIGPSRSKSFARAAGLHMALSCLAHRDAYEGDPDKAPFSRHNATIQIGNKKLKSPPWGRRSAWLRNIILFGSDDNDMSEGSDFAIWPNGEALPFDVGPGSFLEPFGAGSWWPGAVVVLPLRAAAGRMVVETPRPFVSVRIVSASDSEAFP